MSKKLSKKDTKTKIAEFKAAKKEILEIVCEKKKPTIDDTVAHIEATSHYGVLIDSAISELEHDRCLNEILMMRFARAIRFAPNEDVQSPTHRASTYHERFTAAVTPILADIPWHGRKHSGIGLTPSH